MSEAATTSTDSSSVKIDPSSVHTTHEFKVGVPMLRCVFDPAGKYVFGAGQGTSVWRVRIDDGSISELPGHKTWVFALAIHPHDAKLVSGGGDGMLRWWPAGEEKPEPIHEVKAHEGWIRDAVFSPDGTLLATAGNDNLVKLWQTSNGELVRELSGHEFHVFRLAFHPDGSQLVSGDLTLRLKQWEVESGKEIRELHAPSLHRIDKNHNLHIGGTRGIAFNSDGSKLAVCGIREAPNSIGGDVRPGTVIFDFATGEIKREQKTKVEVNAVAWKVIFRPDDYITMVAGGKDGGRLYFWKQDEVDDFHAFQFKESARDMAFSTDGIQIVTAHHDGHLRISSLLPTQQA